MFKRLVKTGSFAGFSAAVAGLSGLLLLLLPCRVAIATAFASPLPRFHVISKAQGNQTPLASSHRAQLAPMAGRPHVLTLRRQGAEIVPRTGRGRGKKRGSWWLAAPPVRQKIKTPALHQAAVNGFSHSVSGRSSGSSSRSSRAPPQPASFPHHGAACSVASSP